jgi:hypothetical protein
MQFLSFWIEGLSCRQFIKYDRARALADLVLGSASSTKRLGLQGSKLKSSTVQFLYVGGGNIAENIERVPFEGSPETTMCFVAAYTSGASGAKGVNPMPVIKKRI